MRMQTHRQTFKDTQKDTKKHSDTHAYRNTLRYKHKDTHINVSRPTNILKDMHTQKCS